MDRKQYLLEYQSRNVIQKKLVFNRRSADDLMLLDWLETRENTNQYVKSLIRADMQQHNFVLERK